MDSLPIELIAIIFDFLSIKDKISFRNTNNFIKTGVELIDIRISQMNEKFDQMYLQKYDKKCINSACNHTQIENVWPWFSTVNSIHITGAYIDIREIRRMRILEKKHAQMIGFTGFYKKTNSPKTLQFRWDGFYACEFSHTAYIPYCLPCFLKLVLPWRTEYSNYHLKQNGVISFHKEDYFY